MNTLTTPELLQRINALLLQATGLAIDADRMHADALYARDVLLVCDALADSEGPALAQHFRALQTRHSETAATPAQPKGNPAAEPARAERRAKGLRDRRRQRLRPPSGRDRRREPRRSVDAERAMAAAMAAAAAVSKARPGPRIFNAIFGHSTQPPDEEIAPDQADRAAPRHWFSRRLNRR